jgi:NTE family protein
LALSGGGARGIAHLGMMQVLEEEGISFDIVSGTSAGALAGVFYCYGYSPTETLYILRNIPLTSVFKPAWNWRGLFTFEKASEALGIHFRKKLFSDLKVPLVVTATDLQTGTPTYFDSGEFLPAVLASCSIPVVFDPVEINGRQYIDGGVLSNLPVEALQGKCEFTIGMHCSPVDDNYKAGSWRDVMERALNLAIASNVKAHKEQIDVFLEPPGLKGVGVFDFKRLEELYTVGYKYAGSMVPEIIRKLEAIENEKIS